jgi:type I restriction enzyme S subunit
MRTVPLYAVTRQVRQVVDVRTLDGPLLHFSIPALEATGLPAIEDPTDIDSAKQRLRGGEVLISRLNPRKSRIATVPLLLDHIAVASTEFVVLDPIGIDRRFLAYLLASEATRQQLDSAVRSVTRSHQRVDPEVITQMRVALPQDDDQRRIADFLDDQVARIDNIVDTRRRQIDLELELFQDFRETEVESDPSSPRLPLIHLTQRDRPINYGVLMPGPRLEAGIPLVEAGDVMRGPIRPDELRLTAPAIEAEYARSRLLPGDLVMAIRGSIGAVQIVPGVDGVLNVTRDAARISLDRRLGASAYVRHAMTTRRVQDWFRLRVLGSAVTGINIGDLRKVPIVVPSFSVQQARAEAVDAAEQKVLRTQALMRQSLAALTELRRSLITAAVTGEFDVSSADGSRVSA